MSYLEVVLEDNLNDTITHSLVDEGPLRVQDLLRRVVGYEFRWNQDFTTAETYAELHVEEAIIQLQYAALALESK